MSIKARRDSLLKSSISIKSMRDSVAKFNKGLQQAKKNAFEIVKNTKESNLFKKSLIARDNNFFRRRQENIRRKEREDEIEAASLQGPAKQKGSILAKSTRGFLGRLLDFVGILLIGWAVANLPKIIAALSGVIKLIRRVTAILGTFINTIKNIIVGIGSVISSALSKIPNFDYQKNKKEIEENLQKVSGGLTTLDRQLVTTSNEFTEFGDEMEAIEQQYEEEKNEEDNESNLNDEQQNQNEQASIDAQKEKIGFGVNKLGSDIEKDNIESNEEGQIDPTQNIRPLPQTEEMPEMEVKTPEDEIKKTIEENLDTSGIDGKKILDKEISGKMKGTETETPVLLQKITPKESNISDARKSVENIQGNITSEFASFMGERKEEFDKVVGTEKTVKPVRKRKSNVRGRKKSKNNTIFIVEKPVEMGNSQMGSVGSSKKFNFEEQVQLEQTLMKLQSTSTLKYT
tara:strand:- start:817 stop:2193 length:1377 start_codon:yes stop_codon:yes gene_type:complete